MSSEATTCPHCGYTEKPTVVERTGKGLKKARLSGVLVIIIGLITMCSAASAKKEDMAMVGMVLILAGVVEYIVARVMTWWRHG